MHVRALYHKSPVSTLNDWSPCIMWKKFILDYLFFQWQIGPGLFKCKILKIKWRVGQVRIVQKMGINWHVMLWLMGRFPALFTDNAAWYIAGPFCLLTFNFGYFIQIKAISLPKFIVSNMLSKMPFCGAAKFIE